MNRRSGSEVRGSNLGSGLNFGNPSVCWANLRTPGNSDSAFHNMDQGMHPLLRIKGAYPVVCELAKFMANSMAGNLINQLLCPGSTHCLSIWVIVLLARSVAPSDWGWNKELMRSSVPVSSFRAHTAAPVSKWDFLKQIVAHVSHHCHMAITESLLLQLFKKW